MALSTVIALFLPEFGPGEVMDGGVGVVIRTTIVAPIVFSLLYLGGRLISYLTGRLIATLIGRLMEKLRMSIITAGIEQGLRDAANHRAKKLAPELAREMAKPIADAMVKETVDAAVKEAVDAAVKETTDAAVKEAVDAAVKEAVDAAAAASAREQLAQEAFIEFMRSKGVADAEIDAFIRRLSQQS